jgi:hypothetical protein
MEEDMKGHCDSNLCAVNPFPTTKRKTWFLALTPCITIDFGEGFHANAEYIIGM